MTTVAIGLVLIVEPDEHGNQYVEDILVDVEETLIGTALAHSTIVDVRDLDVRNTEVLDPAYVDAHSDDADDIDDGRDDL